MTERFWGQDLGLSCLTRPSFEFLYILLQHNTLVLIFSYVQMFQQVIQCRFHSPSRVGFRHLPQTNQSARLNPTIAIKAEKQTQCLSFNQPELRLRDCCKCKSEQTGEKNMILTPTISGSRRTLGASHGKSWSYNFLSEIPLCLFGVPKKQLDSIQTAGCLTGGEAALRPYRSPRM